MSGSGGILLLKPYYSTKNASRYACSRSNKWLHTNRSSSTIPRAGVQFRFIICAALVLAVALINSIILIQ